MAKKLGNWGVSKNTQLVAYDATNVSIASWFWWLLRAMGHNNVAVLDGGFKNWKNLGFATNTNLPKLNIKQFRPYMNSSDWVSTIDISKGLALKKIKLIDARTAERFQGINEPIDPIAGHIPYAINRPFHLNLDNDGIFLSKSKLQNQLNSILGDTQPEQVVHMCGSGVTACHNLLAMEYAGLSGSKLYVGSWSEWITNQNRTIIQ